MDPVERAMHVMHGLQAERAATEVIPGRGIDRFIARLVDAGALALIVLVAMPLASLVGLTADGEQVAAPEGDRELEALTHWGPTAVPPIAFVVLGVFVGFFVVFELLSHRSLGGTPGKLRTRLQIVDAVTLAPASGARLIARTLVWAIPLAFGLLTVFESMFYSWGSIAVVVAMYLWSRRDGSRGRPFWDVLAGTRVVSTEPPRS